jgi:uncharacterized membrane protein
MTTQTLDAGTETPQDTRDPRFLLLVGGAIGLAAAFILTVDKIGLLKDEIAGEVSALGCDLNAFVSCSAVMSSPEAEVFGFANSILGVIGFSVVLTLGVLLLARTPLPGFVWAGLQLGVLFGIGFVTWLQSQSIYDFEKLCPWCMVVWAVMIPIFVGVTARNLRAWAPHSAVTRFVSNWTVLIVALWYVAVASAIWFQFGETLWA